jgi:hypothetical protein
MIGWRKAADSRPGRVESLAAPKDGVEDLERRMARSEALNAWHR